MHMLQPEDTDPMETLVLMAIVLLVLAYVCVLLQS